MWKPGQSRNPAGHSGVDRTWRTAPQCRYFLTALIDRIDVGANQIDIRLRPRRLGALLDIATSAFTCGLGPRLNWERASTPTMIEEIRFAADSPLEGGGLNPQSPVRKDLCKRLPPIASTGGAARRENCEYADMGTVPPPF
jgi:hypothetical protein